jgi:hypothetical protein
MTRTQHLPTLRHGWATSGGCTWETNRMHRAQRRIPLARRIASTHVHTTWSTSMCHTHTRLDVSCLGGTSGSIYATQDPTVSGAALEDTPGNGCAFWVCTWGPTRTTWLATTPGGTTSPGGTTNSCSCSTTPGGTTPTNSCSGRSRSSGSHGVIVIDNIVVIVIIDIVVKVERLSFPCRCRCRRWFHGLQPNFLRHLRGQALENERTRFGGSDGTKGFDDALLRHFAAFIPEDRGHSFRAAMFGRSSQQDTEWGTLWLSKQAIDSRLHGGTVVVIFVVRCRSRQRFEEHACFVLIVVDQCSDEHTLERVSGSSRRHHGRNNRLILIDSKQKQN